LVVWYAHVIGFDESILNSAQEICESVGWVPVDDLGNCDFACEGVNVGMEDSSVIINFWRLEGIVVLQKQCDYEVDIVIKPNAGPGFDLNSHEIRLAADIRIDFEKTVFV
jgi:hypothetical protein